MLMRVRGGERADLAVRGLPFRHVNIIEASSKAAAEKVGRKTLAEVWNPEVRSREDPALC